MNTLETVARTLWRCSKRNGVVTRGATEDDGWRDFVCDAREVIESLRDPPTGLLHDDVLDPRTDHDWSFGVVLRERVWDRIIDAAVKESG